MRTSRLIFTIVVLLACSIFLIGGRAKPKPVEMVKTIGDTWANPDYNVIENKYAKIKLMVNNKWVTYNTTSCKELLKKGTYTIVEGWQGDEYKNTFYDDNTCYKVIRTTDDGIKKYELYRFSELYEHNHFGKVLEIVSSTEDFPTEINTDDSTYSILYLRQGKRIVRTIVSIPLVVILILISLSGGPPV